MSYTEELYRPIYDGLAVPALIVIAAVVLEATADWGEDDTAVTGMSSHTGLVVGQSYPIAGEGIPDGATLEYGPVADTGILSVAATAAGVEEPVDLTISGELEYADIPVIDKTAGFQEGGVVDVATIQPAATVLAEDLATAGTTIDAIQGANITFNGQTWRISSSKPRPSPGGEADGEYLLYLEA